MITDSPSSEHDQPQPHSQAPSDDEDADIETSHSSSSGQTEQAVSFGDSVLSKVMDQLSEDLFNSSSSVNPNIIDTLQTKQQLLFVGFLRESNVTDVTDQTIQKHEATQLYIPHDIARLCYLFFELNISKICVEIHKKKTHNIRDRNIECAPDIIDYDDLYHFAMILRGRRDCFLAYEVMNSLLTHKPGLSEYHNAMGLILKRWSCYAEAENHYKIAINSEQTENIYKWNYGLLLEEQQKFNEALEQFLSASENVDEKEPDYIFEAAYCYQKLGDFDNATINYLKAIDMDNSKSSYWIYYAEYLCEELKDYEQSIRCFEKAISLEKESNLNYYYRFARYLRDFHKNYELSEVYYKKCLQMNEEGKEKKGKCGEIKGVNGSYGYLLYLMKKYEESAKYLSLAQLTDPQNAWSFYYYGLLHITYLKNNEKAMQLLKKAISVCTTHFSIKKHLEIMKEIVPDAMWYHEKFEAFLKDKFDC